MSVNIEHRAIILFDGVCNLCNWFVRLIISHDPDGRYSFAALQSHTAVQLFSQMNLTKPVSQKADSVILIENGKVFTRSDAVIRIATNLKKIRLIAFLYKILPLKIRDHIYDFIAKRRYRWFGRRDACMAPSAGIAKRFL
jgi:predicted DCC family thiol-disulfide oxidoreductase YuxK